MEEDELELLVKHLVDFTTWLGENRPYHKGLLYSDTKDYLARIKTISNIDMDVLLFRAEKYFD